MVCISKYSHFSEAQRDLDRLGSRGIDAIVQQGNFAGVVGGNAPSFELYVAKEDLAKIDAMRDELMEEIHSENPYCCPECGSRDYESFVSGNLLVRFFEVFKMNRLTDSGITLKCNSCENVFEQEV